MADYDDVDGQMFSRLQSVDDTVSNKTKQKNSPGQTVTEIRGELRKTNSKPNTLERNANQNGDNHLSSTGSSSCEESEADRVAFDRHESETPEEMFPSRSFNSSRNTLTNSDIVNFDSCDTEEKNQDDNINHEKKDESNIPLTEATIAEDVRSTGCWKHKYFKCIRKLLLPLVGLALYGYDIYTDIALAMKYYSDDRTLAQFTFTIIFLCVPAILIMLVDISWHIIDSRAKAKGVDERKSQEPKNDVEMEVKFSNASNVSNNCYQKKLVENSTTLDTVDAVCDSSDGKEMDHLDLKLLSRPVWWARTVGSIFTLGVLGLICRTLQYTYYFMKASLTSSKDRHDFYKRKARQLQRDCYMFNFIEVFLESAPQLALQLYITFAFDKPFSHERLRSMILSTASITWNYSAYYRCNRANAAKKQDINFKSFVIFLLSTLSCIVPRFVCVMLFYAFFKSNLFFIIPVSIVFVVHLILVFIWIVKINPKLKGTVVSKIYKYFYYGFFSYVQFFLFLNLQGSNTKKSILLLYSIIYSENLVLAVLSFLRMRELGKSEDAFILLCLPVGFCVHVVCLMIFYGLCHPKTGKCKDGCF